MKLQTMRLLDSLVGIPALFAMKVVYTVLGLRARRIPRRESVRDVLIIKCFGMGSLLLARPLMQEIKREFPRTKLHLLTFESNRALVDLLPEIDAAHYINTKSGAKFFLSTLSALWRLNRARIRLSFDLEFFSKFTSLCSLLVGAPWRVGFYLQTAWRKGVYTHNAYFNSNNHVALVFLGTLGYALGERDQVHLELEQNDPNALMDDLPPLALSSDPRRAARDLVESLPGSRTIAVNINASDLSFLRRWSPDSFATLIDHILEQDTEASIVMIGSPSEKAYVQSVTKLAKRTDRLHDLSGEMTIPVLLAFLAEVDLLITNDSGPLHMAACQGTDTISIFGPETPKLYGPVGKGRHYVLYRGIFCSPCLNVYNNKLTQCRDNICINKIGWREVAGHYSAWLEEIDRARAPRNSDHSPRIEPTSQQPV